MLLRSLLQIKHHNRQHYWFNVSLTVQAIYLFLDGTRTLLMNRCQGKDRAISASYEADGLEFKIRMRWLASQKKSSFVYIVTSEHY